MKKTIRIDSIATDGPLVHEPFDETRRDKVRTIQSIFAEVDPLSLTEWEVAFRRDRNPDREIDLWLRMGELYQRWTEGVTSPAARHEIYAIILSSSFQSRRAIAKEYPKVLTHAEFRALAAELWPNDDEEGVLFKPIVVSERPRG